MKTSVCESFCVQNCLCVKVSVCKSVCKSVCRHHLQVIGKKNLECLRVSSQPHHQSPQQRGQAGKVIGRAVKTRERRGSSFSQLGLEPNRAGLTAQSLFFLEESCRVKRSDTQTFSNFSNYFKRVLKLQKRSSSFSK